VDCHPLGEQDKTICVSYLGWNVRGIVAEEIDLSKPQPVFCGKAVGARDYKPKKPKKP
jgi:hypothetical protein